MPNLPLKLACNDYDRCRALFDGTVKPEGISLSVTRLKPRELFPRMLDHQEFDVAELSLASYATLVARDASPFVAIPVMLSKLLRHSCIYVRRGAGIERPQDLKGKRVATTQYDAGSATANSSTTSSLRNTACRSFRVTAFRGLIRVLLKSSVSTGASRSSAEKI